MGGLYSWEAVARLPVLRSMWELGVKTHGGHEQGIPPPKAIEVLRPAMAGSRARKYEEIDAAHRLPLPATNAMSRASLYNAAPPTLSRRRTQGPASVPV